MARDQRLSAAHAVRCVQKRKSLLLFLRADSLEYAQSWVNVLNYALQTAKSVDFAPKWSLDTMQTFIASASGYVALLVACWSR